MRSLWLMNVAGGMMAAVLAAQSGGTKQSTAAGSATDWPMYRHDLAGTGYSPLTQIDAKNVANLTQAWTYRLQTQCARGCRRQGRSGRREFPGDADRRQRRHVSAGREPRRGARAGDGEGNLAAMLVAGGAPSRRGVAYWPGDGGMPPRIIFTAGRRLIALNAKTGAARRRLRQDGEVDMVVPYNSVPLVYRNVVVVGANTPPGTIGGIGNPRAFDARTGAKLWEFSSVPQPGEVGHDTWEGDSWKDRLGVNAWPFYFTLDEQRGLLYLPLASPIVGAYGGDRKGANLFGNSVVAVDVQTGTYKWHFQTIHHDLWDADPPAPPGLVRHRAQRTHDSRAGADDEVRATCTS